MTQTVHCNLWYLRMSWGSKKNRKFVSLTQDRDLPWNTKRTGNNSLGKRWICTSSYLLFICGPRTQAHVWALRAKVLWATFTHFGALDKLRPPVLQSMFKIFFILPIWRRRRPEVYETYLTVNQMFWPMMVHIVDAPPCVARGKFVRATYARSWRVFHIAYQETVAIEDDKAAAVDRSNPISTRAQRTIFHCLELNRSRGLHI